MMALKLKDKKKGTEAKVKPVLDSLAIPMKPYCPETTGAAALLLRPETPTAPPGPTSTRKKTRLNEPKKPKRPLSSYAHFTAEFRSNTAGELDGKTFGEVNQILSEKWRAMSDEEKIPYKEKSKGSKAAYNQALKKYQAEMERSQRVFTEDTANLGGELDTSLLEKVVKLKSTDGISFSSKFEYYYVLVSMLVRSVLVCFFNVNSLN